MKSSSARSPRPRRPIGRTQGARGCGARRLERLVHRGRRPEVALPLGLDRAARHRLDGRDPHHRHRPLQGQRAGPQTRPIPPEALYRRRHRRAQEPGRGRIRSQEAQLAAREEGHGQQDGARVAADPRPQAGTQRAGQGRPARERSAQGQCKRPDLPRADGDGERPVPLA